MIKKIHQRFFPGIRDLLQVASSAPTAKKDISFAVYRRNNSRLSCPAFFKLSPIAQGQHWEEVYFPIRG